MKINCPYCGNPFEDTSAQCPHCMAPNEHRRTESDGTPTTIEGLRRWYEEKKLPPYSVTRFFIGENVSEPRAFGIYRDGKNVIVYKNKDNGARAVRYSGTDEAYAVSEIFTKLKDEILHQKQINFDQNHSLPTQSMEEQSGSGSIPAEDFASAPQTAQPAKRSGCLSKLLLIIAIFLILSFISRACSSSADTPAQGYYNYDGNAYYYQNDNSGWYSYNNGQWNVAQNVPQGLLESYAYNNYYSGSNYNNHGGYDYYYSDFSDSDYYDDDYYSGSSYSGSSYSDNSYSYSDSSSSWDDDDDDDWSWDSGDSWDSSDSDSDWDSDW